MGTIIDNINNVLNTSTLSLNKLLNFKVKLSLPAVGVSPQKPEAQPILTVFSDVD